MPRLLSLLVVFLLGAVPLPSVAETRVATLLPFVEDALERAAPDEVDIVASVRRDLRVPLTSGAADLGNPHAPSLETLVAARPDLVVGDRLVHGSLRLKLERSGAEILLIDTTSVDGTLDALMMVARQAGIETQMRREVGAARARLSAARLAEPVRVLALFGTPGSTFAFTERTWFGDLLARVGYENVAPEPERSGRFPGLVPLNDEIVATLRPDLVLLVTHGDVASVQASFEALTRSGGAWGSLGRSARKGMHTLDASRFASNPGLALPEAAQALVALGTPQPPPNVGAPPPLVEVSPTLGGGANR